MMFIPYSLTLMMALGVLRGRPRLSLTVWAVLMVVCGVMFYPHIREGHPLSF